MTIDNLLLFMLLFACVSVAAAVLTVRVINRVVNFSFRVDTTMVVVLSLVYTATLWWAIAL